MSKSSVPTTWRESRRQSARAAILEAAWAAVREVGLAGLSLRDLAGRAGISTPTVYAYFESKNAIYDAMFAQAAQQFADDVAAPFDVEDPAEVLVAGAHRFVDFCVADNARYQLLFQRTIPGFKPSAEAYAPAVLALESPRARLALNGVTAPEHLDIWTALITGLVDQQISNDPDGERWIRLIDQFVAMFLSYCQKRQPTRPRKTLKGAVR